VLLLYPGDSQSIDSGAAGQPSTIIPYGSGQFTAESPTRWNSSGDPITSIAPISVQHGFGGLTISLMALAATFPILFPNETDVPTAPGYTVNISNNIVFELIYQEGGAGNSTGVTINMPPTPFNGQLLVILTSTAIAGMTMSPGYLISNPPASMAANSAIAFLWLNGRWMRLF